MHRPDEDVEADSDKLFGRQQNVLVVSRQVLLQVLAPLSLVCGAATDQQANSARAVFTANEDGLHTCMSLVATRESN